MLKYKYIFIFHRHFSLKSHQEEISKAGVVVVVVVVVVLRILRKPELS
jgi:hypothetical protein